MKRLFSGVLAFVMMGLLSCSEEDPIIPSNEENVKLLSLWIRADDNREQLIEDVQGSIEGDSLVHVWIPHICNDKKLIVEINAVGGVFRWGTF